VEDDWVGCAEGSDCLEISVRGTTRLAWKNAERADWVWLAAVAIYRKILADESNVYLRQRLD
jgi:hypothetical protein